MKTKFLFLLMTVCSIVTGCRKAGEFTIKNSTEFVVPGNSVIGTVIPSPMEVSTSSDYEFKNNDTEAKYVKEVKLEKLTLTIKDPSSQTFSFLNSIHIFIYTDDLPETEIAYLDNIPSNVGNSIELLTTGATLDAYIKRDKYKLKVKTVTDEFFAENITIKSDLTFRVKAKVL